MKQVREDVHWALPWVMLAVVFCGCVTPKSAFAQALSPRARESVPPSHRVSVLTFEPGKDVFAVFGHTALVVEYGPSGASKVYNFGTFNYNMGSAKWLYLRGNIEYWLSVSTLRSTLKRYRHFGRGGILQELDLSPDRATWLAKSLEALTHPSRRHYSYRHFDNNCCTKVRDLVDQATDRRLSATYQPQPATRSYREWTRHLMAPHPLLTVLVDFALGPAADRPISRYEEEFIPQVFARDLAAVKHVDGRPLVARTERIHPQHPVPQMTSLVSHPGSLSLGLGLLALFFTGGIVIAISRPQRWASRRWLGASLVLFGLSSGMLGALLTFLQFSLHGSTHGNENHLLTPVSHFWLIVPGLLLLVGKDIGPGLRRATGFYLWGTLGLVGLDGLWKGIARSAQDNVRFLLPLALATLLLIVGWRRVLKYRLTNGSDSPSAL